MQEASVAGESPDGSKRERSSGETAESASVVPPETDEGAPEAAQAAADGSGGDARLRAAVAAWVSTSGEDGGDDGGEDADARQDGSKGGGSKAGEKAEDRTGGKAEAESRGEPEAARPEAPAADAPRPTAPKVDNPTAMFSVLRPGESGEGDPEAAARHRAELLTNAYFGTPRRAEQEGAEGATGAGDAPGAGAAEQEAEEPQRAAEEAAEKAAAKKTAAKKAAAKTTAAKKTTAKKAAAKKTAAKKTTTKKTATKAATKKAAEETAAEKPAAGEDAQSGSGAKRDDDASKSSPAPSGAKSPDTLALTVNPGRKPEGAKKGNAAAAVDHPTTAIRVPRTPKAGQEDKGGQEDKAGKGGASGQGEQARAESERPAAAVPAPRPDAPERAPEADAGPKPKPKPEPDAAPEPESAAEAKSERTSQFIPLKSVDPRESAPAAAQPPEAPAAAGPAAPSASPPPPPAAPPAAPAAPPKELPPLDLLAQLTNKPAPPETPMRMVVRRVKIWTPLLLLAVVLFVVAQVVRPLPDTSLSMTAATSYTFDGDKPSLPWPGEGQAYVEVSGLGALGSHGDTAKPVPIGSVAKTMTVYVVLQDHALKKGEDGPAITVDKKAEEDGRLGEGNGGESVVDTLKEGDKISLKDAISAVMIPSANNVARLLARWDSDGDSDAFVKKMNDTAKKLGMKNTTYTDPSGLEETTVSTAADQVKLAKKAMEIPALVDITKLPYWTDPSGKQWRNYNTLVPYDGAIGIKPGSTTKAGGNLLFAGRKEIGGTTQLIVGAVLGQHKPPIIDTVNAVSKKLLVAANGTLAARKVVKKGEVVGEVDNGLGGTTPVVATKDVTAVGWGGLKVPLALEPAKDGVPRTGDAGETVGTLTVGDGPGQVKVPVALQEELKEPGFGDKVTRIQ